MVVGCIVWGCWLTDWLVHGDVQKQRLCGSLIIDCMSHKRSQEQQQKQQRAASSSLFSSIQTAWRHVVSSSMQEEVAEKDDGRWFDGVNGMPGQEEEEDVGVPGMMIEDGFERAQEVTEARAVTTSPSETRAVFDSSASSFSGEEGQEGYASSPSETRVDVGGLRRRREEGEEEMSSVLASSPRETEGMGPEEAADASPLLVFSSSQQEQPQPQEQEAVPPPEFMSGMLLMNGEGF